MEVCLDVDGDDPAVDDRQRRTHVLDVAVHFTATPCHS